MTAPARSDARLSIPETDDEVAAQIRALGEWFHNLRLRGVETAPQHFLGDYPRIKWERFAHALPADLRGKTVLDVGCNAGFYSIEMKRRGADRVVAVDIDERYLEQARFAARMSDVSIEFVKLDVYHIRDLGESFDVVLFLGVLYHLRYPLLALDLLHEHVVRDTLVVQSMQRGSSDLPQVEEDYPFSERDIFNVPGYPKMHFVERRYCGDCTNWWIPNRACLGAMLRSAGFHIVGHPEEEVYVCRTGARQHGDAPPLIVGGTSNQLDPQGPRPASSR
jgi:tRNA (mo5U34)-methyltransferase